MLLLVLFVFGGVLLWLRFYTNHGQRLELPDYNGKHIVEATEDAEDRSFQLVVKDSTHRVGVPGGIILSQNPKPGSRVKENRKIYVDVAKYNPDLIALADMRPMYGREYENKRKELASQFINSKIKGRRYDPGEPNHILEVWYEGELIDGNSGRKTGVNIKVGSTLEFIVSSYEGGQVSSTDYSCKTLREAKWIFDQYRLRIGDIERIGVITDMDNAYIIAQDPPHEEGKEIPFGTRINLSVQQEKPERCESASQ
ncbi:MAG: PASTA domain-containing protein [Bacteroidia bacterium]|nr:PASTA domain-containing protein [Bacteroidia bacterium]